ncbi:hypothetical protein AB9M10_15600 [Rhodococcus erythropolis]
MTPEQTLHEAERLANDLLTCWTNGHIDEMFTATRDRIGTQGLTEIALPALHLIARRHVITIPISERRRYLDQSLPDPWDSSGDTADPPGTA